MRDLYSQHSSLYHPPKGIHLGADAIASGNGCAPDGSSVVVPISSCTPTGSGAGENCYVGHSAGFVCEPSGNSATKACAGVGNGAIPGCYGDGSSALSCSGTGVSVSPYLPGGVELQSVR